MSEEFNQNPVMNLQANFQPINSNDMNFFQQLNDIGPGLDLAITMKHKNGKYTVSVLPTIGNKTPMQPLIVTGTPEELDKDFFTLIRLPLQETGAKLKNVEEFKKSVDKETEESKSADKKDPVKKQDKKTSKKPVAKKEAPKKKEPPIKKLETPKVQEQSIFDEPVVQETETINS